MIVLLIATFAVAGLAFVIVPPYARAVAALVFGILSLVLLLLPWTWPVTLATGLIAVINGVLALGSVRRGVAIAGLSCGVLASAIAVGFLVQLLA